MDPHSAPPPPLPPQSPIESTRRKRPEDTLLADPIERIISAPKEALIHRPASPRRPPTPSSVKSKGPTEIILDPLPRLSGEGIFVSPTELRNREIKRAALAELIEHVTTTIKSIPDTLYPQFFQMITKNLFRPLPPPFNPTGEAFDPTEDEPVLEPAWPHLQLIYELFIRFLESPDLNGPLARRFIDQQFILQLLSLFDVEDPRERDLLKTTLHRIYAKFLQLRAFIRKAIHNIFYEFVLDPLEYRHNITEMLEILGSIINGFALPLKEEHKLFLEKTLLPLHKTRHLSLYFRQLDYCVVQFVEKDASLAKPIIMGLLKLWPKTNSTKEVLFLAEIEEILELCGPEHFGPICEPLCRQLAACIDSNHFQVAERALMFWNNDHVVMLMAGQLKRILPCLLPVLSKHSHGHWNKNVQIMVLSALESLMELDSRVFDACVAQLAAERDAKARRKQRQLQLWIEIDAQLGVKDSQERKELYRELSRDSTILIDDEPPTEADQDISMEHRERSDAEATLVRDQRRKSILPISSATFEELLNYSRTPSPTPPTTTEE